MIKADKIRLNILPVAVGVLSVGLAMVSFSFLRNKEIARFDERFEGLARHQYDTVEGTFTEVESILESLRSFFDASNLVDRNEFSIVSREFLKSNPYIQALEWVPRVSRSKRHDYEESARLDGMKAFQFTVAAADGKMVVAPEMDEYFPVYFLEPYAGNELSAGFVLSSDPDRLRALKESCHSGKIIATSSITLVQDRESRKSFIVFLPVCRKETEITTDEVGRSDTSGFVAGVFNVDDMIHHAFRDAAESRMALYLFDSTEEESVECLFVMNPSPGMSDPSKKAVSSSEILKVPGSSGNFSDYKISDLSFAGRKWTIVSIAHDTLVADYITAQPVAVALGILVIGILLVLLFWTQVRRRSVIEREVKNRTKEVNKARDDLDRILGKERDRSRQQASVVSFGQEVLSGISLDEILESAVSLVSRVLGTEYAKVLEHFPEKGELFLRAGIGWKEGWVGCRSVPDGAGSQGGYTLLQDNPVIVDDIRNETRFSAPSLLTEHGVTGGMVVAIPGESMPFGVLGVHTARMSHFSENDARFLESVANILAAALMRARADEKMIRSESRFRTLFNTTSDAIMLLDDTGFFACNKATLSMFEFASEKEFCLMTPADLSPELQSDGSSSMEAAGKRIVTANETGSSRFEWLHKRHISGIIFPAEVLLTAMELDGRPVLQATVRDITKRKRVEERLKESEQRFRAIVDSMADWIWEVDLQGRYTYCSDKVESILGYRPDEMVGKTPFEFFSAEEVERVSKIFAGIVLRKEPIRDLVNWNIRKDGQRICLLTSGAPILDEDGELLGYCGVDSDITKRKQAEEKLRETNEDLEMLNKHMEEQIAFSTEMMAEAELANVAKSEFLANMSHEIRTPMNGVIGMTGLLLDTELTEEQRHYAETVSVSAESLLGLINDILDFSKIEAGKLEMEVLDFDLISLMEDFAEMMAIKADEKDLEFICSVEPGMPVALRGDPGRLRQVLINLMGNAVKFTSSGEIVVKASLEAATDEEAVVRFSVRDTGIGIPADKVGTLFDKFTQVDASTTRKFGGTGLGLAISKQLAEVMGGEIGVNSRKGKGSEFWFTARFPRQDEKKRDLSIPEEMSGTRVLVVDDNATSREIISGQLESWGLKPKEAPDGPEALKMLLEAVGNGDPYKVAIVDMKMPEMDGEDLGRTIKADDKLKDTKLLLLVSGVRVDSNRLAETGFYDQVVKPVRVSQLFECMSSILTGKISHKGRSGPTGGNLEKFDSDYRILLAEDNITNQRVALGILKKIGLQADAVANGIEAVDALKLVSYDLVLMDCQMPELDGYKATRRIRDPKTDVSNHEVPVIAMTANAMQGDRERCLEAGMDDYISKPVNPKALSKMLKKWLPGKSGATEKKADMEQRDSTETVPALD